MVKFRPGLWRFARALLTRGMAALLLIQIVALAFSETRPAPMEPGLASAARLCSVTPEGGHAPTAPDQPGHCLYCPLSCAHGGAGLPTLVAATLLLLLPRDAAATGRAVEIDARPVAGATGFRQFSRAPPALV
ncbi:hypothetical protein EDE12_1011218 [Methylosinus sp. sav-2]|uniref:DUF2946 family protein n=1 Tax=Methylosinus sp. sav-2 TaxID=2485168 RepID=UPI001066CBDD|nr:DUF2946 family protein [Methylosinus sp. sav-2]TDX67666.1 hypothetical protein EDE12_1011218 [Methylosinus sp. sav-2]